MFGFFALAIVVIYQGRALQHMDRARFPLPEPGKAFMRRIRDNERRADQVLYADPGGRFSFVHPKDVYVNAGTTTSTQGTVTSIMLTSAPISEGPVPDMYITVTDTNNQSVEFKTWENLDIPYFKELVSSFAFTPVPPNR